MTSPLQVDPVYTVIAEKDPAIVTLGLASRHMKDFYDMAVVAETI